MSMESSLFKWVIVSMIMWLVLPVPLPAESTITYQGRLADGGEPFTGTADMRFTLWDNLEGPSSVGSPVEVDAVSVEDGLFTARLDFGDVFDGQELFLQVEVRSPADPEDQAPYVLLTPRTPLTSAPSAHVATLSNAIADNAVTSESILDGSIQREDLAEGLRHTLDSEDGSILGAVHVDEGGRMGIGIDAPVTPLHVHDEEASFLAAFTSNSPIGSGIAFENGTVPAQSYGLVTSGSDAGVGPGRLLLYGYNGTSSSVGLAMDPSGKISIGHAVPQVPLHVYRAPTPNLPGITDDLIRLEGFDTPGLARLTAFQILNQSGEGAKVSGTVRVSGSTFKAFDLAVSPVPIGTPQPFVTVASQFGQGRLGITDMFPERVLSVNSPSQMQNSLFRSDNSMGTLITLRNMSTVTSNGHLQITGDSHPAGPGKLLLGAGTNGNNITDVGISMTPGGSVGIGHASPESQLHVQTDGLSGMLVRGTSTVGTWMSLSNTSAATEMFHLIATGTANGGGAGNLLVGTGSAPTSFSGTAVSITSSRQVGVMRTGADHPLHVGVNSSSGNGAHVTAEGMWTNGSSREFKTDFREIDPVDLLDRLAKLPITRWRYRESESEHIGPTAEDFHAAFGLGHDEQYIGTVDADGVALAAIQGLHRELRDRDQRITQLEEANSQLEKRLARLEAVLGAQ